MLFCNQICITVVSTDVYIAFTFKKAKIENQIFGFIPHLYHVMVTLSLVRLNYRIT